VGRTCTHMHFFQQGNHAVNVFFIFFSGNITFEVAPASLLVVSETT